MTKVKISVPKITASLAKKLLGWQEESESDSFETDYALKDEYGKKVRLNSNVHNRPIYPSLVANYKRVILSGGWKFNGESIIIGSDESVLDGQHTLISVVLAQQTFDIDGNDNEIFIKKVLVMGVSEEDSVVNTINTGKPRSLADVIFRSAYFSDYNKKERKQISRICSFAIKTIMSRLGKSDAFNPNMTHSEYIDFIESHPKTLSAVNHIYLENVDTSIERYIPLGFAAGLMYLMGTSTSDPREYAIERTEKSLEFSNWDKASDFFVLLSSGNKSLSGYFSSVKKLYKESQNENSPFTYSRNERITMLIEAWLQWEEKGRVGKVIRLSYKETESGMELENNPSVGGIDLISETLS